MRALPSLVVPLGVPAGFVGLCLPGHGKPSPAGPAQPGPKFLGLGQPEHACGLGLGQRFRPDCCVGPGLGLRNVPNKEEAWPEARNLMGICCDGPGLGRNSRPDGRDGPGLGLVFFCTGLC
jgi:hypothetical protein